MDDCLPYIDVDDALERVRGNKTVLKSLFTVFLKDDFCLTLTGQLEAGRREDAARTAHALKGVAANLSLRALYEAVLMIELHLKTDAPLEDGLSRLMQAREQTRRCAEQLISV